jgi:hypothetical protein
MLMVMRHGSWLILMLMASVQLHTRVLATSSSEDPGSLEFVLQSSRSIGLALALCPWSTIL